MSYHYFGGRDCGRSNNNNPTTATTTTTTTSTIGGVKIPCKFVVLIWLFWPPVSVWWAKFVEASDQ